MKGHIKDYFTFTKSERIGITILLSLIIIILIIPSFVKDSIQPGNASDELYKAEVNEFLKGINQEGIRSGDNDSRSPQEWKVQKRFTPHYFDPNNAGKEEWEEMGFSEKQAATIVKFRIKGGKFYKKEDFKKLYVVDETIYNIFEPFITIKDSAGEIAWKDHYTQEEKKTGDFRVEKVDYDVELNSADSAELLKINGVGPVFASRILKYRKRLGGFSSIEQLHEVYGIDSTRFTQIASQVLIDSVLITKIDINTAAINDLKKHPYLDYYLAKAIIDRRVQRGKFSSLSELREIFRTKPGLFERISPYLTLFTSSPQ